MVMGEEGKGRGNQREVENGRWGKVGGGRYFESVVCFDGGRQGVVVSVGEEEEVLFEVYVIVFDIVYQVQFFQMVQVSYQVIQLVVVYGGFFYFFFVVRVRLFFILRWRWQLYGRKELIYLDFAYIFFVERQQVEDYRGVRGVWDEVFQQVFQVSFKEYAFLVVVMFGYVVYRLALYVVAALVVFIIDQVGGYSQRQVRGQVVQDFLLVFWEQLFQDRVVFGNRGRKVGVIVLG